jgi:competence protein ComEA
MQAVWNTLIALAGLLFSAAASFAGPVNVNTADAATLAAELNGVGVAIAEEIVRDREKNGRFENAEALMRVTGVGPRIIERNREFILTNS